MITNFLNYLRKLLLKMSSKDVYDINAFYARRVYIQEFYDDQYIVIAVMADATPSKGTSRYHDQKYDYHEVIEYAGEVVFDLHEAMIVKKILEQKSFEAHL